MNLAIDFNNSDLGNISSKQDLIPYVLDIVKFYESKGIKITPYPKLTLSEDDSSSSNVFGKTGWYDPSDFGITLIVTGRHPKDILRTFAHELIHHNQHVTGKLDTEQHENLSDPKYAQNNKHLRLMEADAYVRGNLLFRDWTDNISGNLNK